MQKLIDATKIGALTRAAAINEAEHLIGNYSRTREQDAWNWLQKRTNQPSLLVLPPEMQLQLETQRNCTWSNLSRLWMMPSMPKRALPCNS